MGRPSAAKLARQRTRNSTPERRAKAKTYMAAYYIKNREKLIAQATEYKKRCPLVPRGTNLRRNGWTLEMYERVLVEQKFLCAICTADLSEVPIKQVHADHCHSTGKPRGILCQACNTGLGGFRDNPVALSTAVDYLAKHREGSP